MTKFIAILSFLTVFGGCTAATTKQEPEKYYNVYDENGRRKGYIKQQGENYILYNEKWQREGYIKSE